MLRVKTKENFIRVLRNVALLCKQAIEKDDVTLISVLQDSQDAIIAVGEQLEKEVEESAEIISKMEALCETFFLLSQNLEHRDEYGKQIAYLSEQIVSAVSNVTAGYQIVFFPYKAEMWDSLESIWQACKEDPLCDCKVVPIPYYHFDANQNKWLYRYEIDNFPAYVPVVHYTDYSLDEQADAAFVHNPYDELNYVTHIHSDYYSYNLKKYVNNLFYVPYYVTSGFISENHKSLSVYQNADYLVVQSETFKEGLKDYDYSDKALVMGSPKLDRVIRLSENPDSVSEEWNEILKGNKSLMLNTSLHQFLQDGEAYLQKIAHLFDVVKKRDDVVIIWRPHPLLLSTIESMRPELMSLYQELQQTFVDEKIGIFDTTPDIINTVAAVDGYIGEASSSVVNLFEAVGKPLFILNNYITEDFSPGERRQVLMSGCHKVGDYYYCTSVDCSDVFVVKGNAWNQMRQKAVLPAVAKWKSASIYGTLVKEKVYFAPTLSEEFIAYDIQQNEAKQISSIQGKRALNYQFAATYKNKIFYLPNAAKHIAEYDVERDIWAEHREPIKALQRGVTERIFEEIRGRFVEGKYIWATNLYSNRVLCFDMETSSYQIYKIGDTTARYSGVAVVEDKLYLSDAYSGRIQVWDYKTGEMIDSYSMPEGYRVHMNAQGRVIAHSQLWVANNSLFAIPGTSNALVQIDLQTGDTVIVEKELWSDALEPANFYDPRVSFIVGFSQLVDGNTLLVQKRRDASLLEINTQTGEYQIHHPQLAPGELEKLLAGEDGFEKIYTNGEFARRESRYFSFEGFLDDLVNDRLGDATARQKKAMETMAVNLDGTCGEKVHEFMMNVLKTETRL